MNTLLILLLVTGAACAQGPSAGASQAAADVIFFDGNILTGAHLLEGRGRTADASVTPSRVSAVAVVQGRVVAVGPDAEVLKRKGVGTRMVDLHGAFAMPGFNDAHTHIAAAGRQKLTVDLDGTASLSEMQARIKAFTAAEPQASHPEAWIEGAGWDHTKWASKTLPSRADMDAVTGRHPAIFHRTDGHILVANSAALAAAGITDATPDPAGGKIDRDAGGKATGVVREGPAMALIMSHIPPPDPEMRRRALEVAIADALVHGVTSVQDFSDWEDWLALDSMERQGKLKLRVSEWMAFDQPVAVLKQRRASHDPNDPLLHLGQLKAFMDGSLGSRTAALAAPYADDPGNSGIARYPEEKVSAMAAERAAAGFQLGFHAIGDHANHVALDAFAGAEQVAVAADSPARLKNSDAAIVSTRAAEGGDRRFRVEHAQVLLPGDFDRFRELGVIASMQPSHLLTDMNWAIARLGPERAKYSYAWRSMLDHGVRLAFGTDYPVEGVNPMRGLYAAISRQNEAGTATYEPQERISLNEALYAYTQESAYAEFRERTKGRLEPGFVADMVVLDRDITAGGVTPQQILHTRVLRTVVNGETVYEAVNTAAAR
ncbi:MAG: amidohydrolase [Acidobacteriaceae bacterium]